MRKKYVIANFKMNKTPNETKEYTKRLKELVSNKDNKVILCVPYVDLFTAMENAKGSYIEVGAQNIHFEEKGAFTGEVSAKMLSEIGTKYVIIGHSERRQYFYETDVEVNKKIKIVLENRMTPILCIGETLKEKESGNTAEVLSKQLKRALEGLNAEQVKDIIIAYEPLWAISTNTVTKIDENGKPITTLGFVATKEVANDTIKCIRKYILDMYGVEISENIIILYGGSVKTSNFKELFDMSDIDGGLIGGACLDVDGFAQICNYTL